jgi:hypothetical protein
MRPGLTDALDGLVVDGAGVLLVAKRDRLARDLIIGAVVERMAERAGARVLSADEVGNGSGPEDQLMRHLLSAFSEYEKLCPEVMGNAAPGIDPESHAQHRNTFRASSVIIVPDRILGRN